MLDQVRGFLAELFGTEQRTFDEADHRLAAAALLFHVIAVDGVASPEEKETLKKLLMTRYELDGPTTDTLLAEAERADREAVDLYGFTSVLKRKFDAAEREKVVLMMWELVYADGMVHEFEDNVVWRVAELLGVPARDRMRLKREARGTTGDGGD